ncbi:WD-repeat protein, putative [Ectocarpus siliculosus]|uniref:WD-repeat protein, putative n=1 Tax=Ectocarpus siliculosus TaxID=2880 RepID=D7FSG2_ECTSI|nr:WD-repeat protein, putative [Ectocarpus siliculosus]|eukprot:CBJ31103.1 WD-repeat protein, putative [Ectocarpus siliculosus]
MALFRALERRRAGVLRQRSTADKLRTSRVSQLDLDINVEIKSPHHGPVTWLDVDSAEERYLLTGGADCTVAVFDLDGAGEKRPSLASGDDNNSGPRRHGPAAETVAARRRRPKVLREVGRTPRVPLSQSSGGGGGGSYGGHRHSVSVVQWYPVDTGLFVSGAMDGVVKVWDTNTLGVVLEFDFKDKVYSASMSPTTGQHHLIAVGSDSPQARLCDIRSGAFAHALSGHSEAVSACAWSPRSEFLLATGSADQTVRLWDIRRSGASACLISLDQHQEDDEEEQDEEEDDHTVRCGSGVGGSADGSDDGRGSGVRGSGKRKRGYLKHIKLAPHASRASKFARAHAGPVNSLCFAPEGLHLLTAGTDNRLRLWEVETGRNTMTNYLQTKNKRRRPFGMAVGRPAGRRSETVFFPNDKSGDVLVFPLHTPDGRPKGKLRGHFDPVQCCAYRPRTQEVVTCGADGLVLLWSAAGPPWASRASYLPPPLAAGAGGTKRRLGESTEDQDMWSSDDEGGDGSRTSPAFDSLEGVGNSTISSGTGRSGSRRGGRSPGGSGGAFVPRILTQPRRAGPGVRGR